MRKARFVKYIVLFVLIIVFFLSVDRTTLTADPLISFFNNLQFSPAIGGSMLAIVTIIFIGSLFYTRFWCRYLCPAGAFLALLNNIGLLKRYLPPKRFTRCEFGLTASDHSDCIYCDRCRYERHKPVLSEVEGTRDRRQSRYFVAVVVIIAIFVSLVSINRLREVLPAGLSQPFISAGSTGLPRDVDLQRVHTLMEQKRLSDREAEFYKKVE